MLTKIQLRRGTASEWTTANPTLASGEIGVETSVSSSPKLKIGDGTTAWGSLNYLSAQDQSLNTTSDVEFNSVSINGGAAQINSDGSAYFNNQTTNTALSIQCIGLDQTGFDFLSPDNTSHSYRQFTGNWWNAGPIYGLYDLTLESMNYYSDSSGSVHFLHDIGGQYDGSSNDFTSWKIGVDGSASFANGSSSIDGSGIFTNGLTQNNNNGQVIIDSDGRVGWWQNGTRNAAFSYDYGQGRMNLYNELSSASIFLDSNNGSVGVGNYYGNPMLVDSSGNVTVPGEIYLNGGTLSSPDGVSLYWNGTQIA